MSNHLASRLMVFNGVGFIIFALLWMTAAYAPIDRPGAILIDLLQWPLGDLEQPLSQHARWLSAVGAGVLAALGVLTMTIVADGVRRGDRPTARAAILAMLTWFAIDGAGSIASGVASNAGFNLVFLALYITPLLLASGAARGRVAGAAS
jgi:hypothetical protein